MIVAWRLAAVLAVASKGALSADAPIYFTMGRGLLNGLSLYTDLFESKPPGIFLLAALSLFATGDERLIVSLQLALFAAIPLGGLWFALSQSHAKSWELRVLVSAWAFVVCGLLTLYLVERSEPVQTESFGAALGCGFVLAASVFRGRFSRPQIALRGVLLLGAIGMKEPFLVTLFAATLLVTNSRRDFARGFVMPAILATIGGGAILSLLGAGNDYFAVYLPAMLDGRVGGGSAEPLLLRGFAVAKVLYNLGPENPSSPLLATLIGALWLAYPALRFGAMSTRQFLASAAAVAFTYFTLVSMWQFVMLSLLMHRHGLSFVDSFYIWLIAKQVILLAAYAAVLISARTWSVRLSILTVAPVWYLTSLAVGLADYRATHFSVALPVYFALVVTFVQYVVAHRNNALLIGTITVLAIASSFRYAPDSLIRQLRAASHLAYRNQRSNVEGLDEILERCGSPPYFAIGGLPIIAYAKHSPLGPLFVDQPYLKRENRLVQRTRERLDEQARIVIVPNDGELPPSDAYLQDIFQPNPPDCAKSVDVGTGLTLWFR